jgi:hypothetical protein
MNGHIATATIAEAVAPPDRAHVIERLHDWRERVHALYDSVESSLGTAFSYDRRGKNRSYERPVQRVGLALDEVPEVDILRVVQGEKAIAQFVPRDLWIIGANGRVDLVLHSRPGGTRRFMLLDLSLPLSGKGDWHIVRPSDPLRQPPFRPEDLPGLLE